MERADLKLREFQREFKQISMKWDSTASLDQMTALGFASKLGSIKGKVSIWLSEEYAVKLKHEVYESFVRLESDINRVTNEIEYEYSN